MISNLITLGISKPLYAFINSDFVGQAIIGLLLFGSMFVWVIMLEKGLALAKAKRSSEKFIKEFSKHIYPTTCCSTADKDISPVGKVCKSGLEELLIFHALTKEQAITHGQNIPHQNLTISEIDAVRSALERAVASQIMVIEEKIGLLATAVSVSPFFGLFGTVWGVMMAFVGVAQQGSADISALAPGVSGALLTTIAGLVVAIPSLIGYNILTLDIRKITVYMDNFVEEFMAKVKLEQVETQ